MNRTCIPKLPFWLLQIFADDHQRVPAIGDLEELYYDKIHQHGKFLAWLWIWKQVLFSVPYFLIQSFIWSFIMLQNYVKIAVRNIKKYKGYSFINICGLAIGIICCLFIFLFISEELSYDSYHKDKDRIFRIATKFETNTFADKWAAIGPAVGPYVKRDFPQVEYTARIFHIEQPLVKNNNQIFYEEKVYYADQDLFTIFSTPFLQGNPTKALTRSNTVVLSEQMAKKYFSQEIPIGKTISINAEEFEITGVVKNNPTNTHFKYELLVSMESFEDAISYPNWGWTVFHTYLKLAPQVDRKEFKNIICDLEDNYVTTEIIENRGYKNSYFLQPVTDIHLHSNIRDEIETPGNPLYVTMIGIIGLLILLIACINFMNLATARFTKRAKEVRLRKVVGAQRRQLIVQFLSESLLMSLIAFIIAFSISFAVLPIFNELSGKEFTLNDIVQIKTILVSVLLMIVVGFFSGSYPALYLSMTKSDSFLQTGRSSGSGSSFLRKVLVVGQFAISIALLAGTFIVYTQLDFMKNKDLGFDKQQKLLISWEADSSIAKHYKTIKSEFLQLSGVNGITVSSGIPGYGIYGWQIQIVGESDNKKQYFSVCLIDDDFIPEYKIEMAAGRAFKKGMTTDIKGPLIINETAVKSLGWQFPEEALGKHLLGGPADGKIIGVMRDFHFKGIQTKIGPLVMVYSPDYFSYASITVDIRNLDKTLSRIEKKWQELNPGGLFTYRFVDSIFDMFYRSNERTAKLFGLFTILSIFISCLGLFGLTSYTAEQKKKEIGIRKVLGASIPGITILISKKFIKWICIAILIAIPIAYFTMDKWLQNFAYRIDIGIWIFIFSAVIAIFIALLTVSFQTIKAAVANPVHSLKYE